MGRCYENVSPVLDYHDAYMQLGPKLLYAWAALDTHDALTDRGRPWRNFEAIRIATAMVASRVVSSASRLLSYFGRFEGA
jgi:hypothetical protein